ncbi:hypothetical protein [Enhygromyxa salina]|uniref:hypothetical protein n=1 Tax=Enhygromyxa salina TaxID=215803 RepID=UPI0011BA7292|nr:hypothetical protein [Enhygromyxa salina]
MHKSMLSMVAALASATFPVACGDSIDTDERAYLEEEPDAELEIEIDPLVEVEIESGHLISFYVDPSSSPPTVTATEVIPPGAASVLHDARLNEATSLETFVAIAPNANVPPELTISHEIEVAQRGRSDGAPLPFAPQPLKVDPPCTNQSLFSTWFSTMAGTVDGIGSYDGTGPTSFQIIEDTTTYLDGYFGGCNYSDGPKDFHYCLKTSGSWRCTGTYGVTAGSMYYATKFQSVDTYFLVRVTYPYLTSGIARLAYHLVD